MNDPRLEALDIREDELPLQGRVLHRLGLLVPLVRFGDWLDDWAWRIHDIAEEARRARKRRAPRLYLVRLRMRNKRP